MAGPSATTRATRSTLAFLLWTAAVVGAVITALAVWDGMGTAKSIALQVVVVALLGLAAHFVGQRRK